MIYKKNMIRLFCNSCNEEYYSYFVDESNYKEDFSLQHGKNIIVSLSIMIECLVQNVQNLYIIVNLKKY